MAPRAGLEPATLCLEGRCSIQLSYRGLRYYSGRFFFFWGPYSIKLNRAELYELLSSLFEKSKLPGAPTITVDIFDLVKRFFAV